MSYLSFPRAVIVGHLIATVRTIQNMIPRDGGGRWGEGEPIVGFPVPLSLSVSHTWLSKHAHYLKLTSTDARGEAGAKLQWDRLSASPAVYI